MRHLEDFEGLRDTMSTGMINVSNVIRPRGSLQVLSGASDIEYRIECTICQLERYAFPSPIRTAGDVRNNSVSEK